jgi:hypothetical protein
MEALNTISEAKSLNVVVRDLHLVAGLSLAQLKRSQEAVQALEQEIQSFPDNSEAASLLSELRKELTASAPESTKLEPTPGVREALPFHFFTIVLNGQPFIRHHIDEMKKLHCKWHWHIVEGVADLKHDTAWSIPTNGAVPADFHRGGLSIDGTTEYIDQLAKDYPDHVTVYRTRNGQFWDGKREMVSAPLSNIKDECLLWEIDVDELWTAEQFLQMRDLFLANPERTAAFYHCYYFIGPKKYVSSIDTWATQAHDWVRTWRFKPGMKWAAHEPPRLVDERGQDVSYHKPFSRDDTRSRDISFQHFAYVLPEQVRFKEAYYGYADAVAHWNRLQQTVGPVDPADYLPWAKRNARASDWTSKDGELLSTRFMHVLLDDVKSGNTYQDMAVKGTGLFESELNKLFAQIRPTKIIETGTYLGRGTSTLIWKALQGAGVSNPHFTTIEVNPDHWHQAVEWFNANHMNINAELGLSVPRSMLSTLEQIKEEFVDHPEFRGIFYDHNEAERSLLYYKETNFDVPDNLLHKALTRFDFAPDFVLLDSAGHMGYVEFQYLTSLVRSPLYIMLDDIYHCKHYKSLQLMKRDPRFKILVESAEKFGFCIVHYTPGT